MFLHSGSTLKLMGFHIVCGFQPVAALRRRAAPKTASQRTGHRVARSGVASEVKFLGVLTEALQTRGYGREYFLRGLRAIGEMKSKAAIKEALRGHGGLSHQKSCKHRTERHMIDGKTRVMMEERQLLNHIMGC